MLHRTINWCLLAASLSEEIEIPGSGKDPGPGIDTKAIEDTPTPSSGLYICLYTHAHTKSLLKLQSVTSKTSLDCMKSVSKRNRKEKLKVEEEVDR